MTLLPVFSCIHGRSLPWTKEKSTVALRIAFVADNRKTAAERGFEIQISYEAPVPVRREIAEAVENKVLDAIATEIVTDAATETENE